MIPERLAPAGACFMTPIRVRVYRDYDRDVLDHPIAVDNLADARHDVTGLKIVTRVVLFDSINAQRRARSTRR